jgi:hypothetical protein
MVRIAWVTAILLGVLAIVVGWLSGTHGGGSDRTQGASASWTPPGFAFEAEKNAEEAQAPQDHRRRGTEHQIPAEGRSSSGGRNGSVGQPADTGAGTPLPTPQPEPPSRPAPAPRPKPAPAPPQIPVPAQPAPPEPVQPPVTVANNNDGP